MKKNKLDKNNKVNEELSVKSDNPFSKKVKTELESIPHNKNNEVLIDSDLINGVIM